MLVAKIEDVGDQLSIVLSILKKDLILDPDHFLFQLFCLKRLGEIIKQHVSDIDHSTSS